MANPGDRLYTRDHQWAHALKNVATIGITSYAQQQLGEIVYIELIEIGSIVNKDEECGTIESVKAVAEIYAPVSGKIIEVNQAMIDNPEIVNDDPYGEGWLFRIQFPNTSQLNSLLTATQYDDYVKNEEN
jgi:glycine cleavage system H protein